MREHVVEKHDSADGKHILYLEKSTAPIEDALPFLSLLIQTEIFIAMDPPQAKLKSDPPQAKSKSPSGLNRYIREMYKPPWFPSVDDHGRVYLNTRTGAIGKEAKKHRRYLEGENLERHINRFFPQGSIHYVTDPKQRAAEHKGQARSPVASFFQPRTSNSN